MGSAIASASAPLLGGRTDTEDDENEEHFVQANSGNAMEAIALAKHVGHDNLVVADKSACVDNPNIDALSVDELSKLQAVSLSWEGNSWVEWEHSAV